MRERLINCFVILLVAIAASRCNGAKDAGNVVMRDSGGITIVENLAPLWKKQNRWRLSDDPLVSIGVQFGPPEYELFRVHSAVRFDDGRIAVANTGTNELRFYDAHGQFLFARGGDGEEPGEFAYMRSIWRYADSLFLHDIGLARVTVYSVMGDFVRVFRIQPTPEGNVPLPRCMLPSGHLLVQIVPSDQDLDVGLYRDTSLYLRYTLDGEYLDVVDRFAGSEVFVGRSGDRVYSATPPFARNAHFAGAAGRFYFGATSTYEIEQRKPDGILKRLIRRSVPNASITPEDADEYFAALGERLAQQDPRRLTPAIRDMYADMPLPATKPAYGRLVADASGQLWVSDYDSESSWTVFDRDGQMLGSVEVPKSGTVFEIGADYLLGAWRDELGVEQLRVYGITKP